MYETSLERIKKDIETISRFTATPEEGRTCFSYSDEDRKVREYLLSQFEELGLVISFDGVGNIRARLEGSDPSAAPVMSGSHIDSVYKGGNYDGIVGVTGALEAVRVISENKISHKNPIDIIIFSEEEGSNFGSTCAGSKTMVGKYTVEDLKKLKDPDGKSMYDRAREAGYDPDTVKASVVKKGDIKAVLEMHIEQSVILDNEKIPLGIVEAIAGLKQFEVNVTGVPNHAGATPMKLRNDPMSAAARMISSLEDIAKKKALETTVGTVGKILCEPNVSNVIPGKVTFTMDIRDVDERGIEMTASGVKDEISRIGKKYGVKTEMKLLGDQAVVKLSDKVVDTIEDVAKEKNFKYMRMNSGAVHDAVLLAPVTEVGMIFVPSKSGRSHVAVEDTDMADIKLGCDLLLGTIIKLAS